jgi:hypothetical protein
MTKIGNRELFSLGLGDQGPRKRRRKARTPEPVEEGDAAPELHAEGVQSQETEETEVQSKLTGEGTTDPKVEAQLASEITAAAQHEQDAPHPATDTIEAQPTQTLADQDTILQLTYPLQTLTLSFSAIHTIHAVEPTEQACPVCTEIRPLISFTRLSGCTHNPNICQKCLADWLTNSVGNTAVDRIACPSTNCSAIFTYADVQLFANPETFNRYDKLSL